MEKVIDNDKIICHEKRKVSNNMAIVDRYVTDINDSSFMGTANQ